MGNFIKLENFSKLLPYVDMFKEGLIVTVLLAFFTVIIGFVLQIAVTEIPFLVRVFGTYSLHLNEWLILTAVSAIPLVLHELLVPVFRYASKKRSQKK